MNAVRSARNRVPRPRNALVAFCLIVGGGVSILHHGLICGTFFDTADFVGHDWYGLVALILASIVLWRDACGTQG